MNHRITQDWTLDVDEDVDHRIEVGSLVFWKPGRTIYIDVWSFPDGLNKEDAFAAILAETNPKPLLCRTPNLGDLLRYGYLLKERNGPKECFAFHGIVMSDASYAQIVCYDDEADLMWAEATWLSLRYSPDVETANSASNPPSADSAPPPSESDASAPLRDRAASRNTQRLASGLDAGLPSFGSTPFIAAEGYADRGSPMIDEFRLRRPMLRAVNDRAHLRFREVPQFQTFGESVLITDPIYLADVYNSSDDVACFVREEGVIVDDFGGDLSCPVWWRSPFLMLLLAEHSEEIDPPVDVTIIPHVVGCDSGSFVFLPLSARVPDNLKAVIEAVVEHRNGVIVPVMKGVWSVWYEYSFERKRYPRKIVARWEPDEEEQPRLPLWD